MKTTPTRKWTHVAELRTLLDHAVAEPGSKMAAVAMGPHGLEQTLERWAVTTQPEAHTWASGHLKTQARAPTPAVRFRWIRPGGGRAGSVVCRLVDRTAISREAPALPNAAVLPVEDTAELSSLRQQLAAAQDRAQQAEKRAELAERARREASVGGPAAETHTLQRQIQAQRDQLTAIQADLKKAIADCARLARERDALRDQLAEAQAAIARKDDVLRDAMVLAAIVNAQS